MTMHDGSPIGPLQYVAYALFGVGVVLIMAMSFRMMRGDLALFLGTSAFALGGLVWGVAARAPRRTGRDDGQGPTVERR